MKKVAIIMGSDSDYPTMKLAEDILNDFGVEYDKMVVSAHRTPQKMVDFSTKAHEKYDVIIAGAGGAAHLPGMVASMTTLPVIGVPIESKALKGIDSLLSIAQMPGGVPVATMAIGNPGAKNAGLLAVRMLAVNNDNLKSKIDEFVKAQKVKVEEMSLK